MQYDAFGFAIRQKKTSPTRGAFADSELIAGLPPSSSSTSLYQPLDTLSAAPSLSRHAVPRSFIAPASSSSHLFSSSSGLSIATTASTSTRKTSPEGSLRSPKSAASSPAAHFLSSFGSPFAAPAAPAPDTAGQPVPGHPDLTLGALLGTSTDTVVRLASSASGAPSVAVKIVKLPAAGAPHARRTRTRIARERALWAGLAHEHVLPLFGATLTDTRAWFVTLPCGAGSLADLLRAAPRGLPPALAGPLGRQTAKGLRYLHERGLVHRDVKLENVLVDDAGQARLADFGLAVHAAAKGGPPAPESDDSDSDSERDERAPAPAPVTVTVPPPGVAGRPGGMVRRQSTFNAYPSILSMRADIATSAAPGRASRRGSLSLSQPPPRRRHVPGSLPYAAPELFAAAPAPPAPAQDVWALGCVLHALACGELPFADPFEPRLVVKIQHAVYTPPTEVTEAAALLLRGCFDRNPDARWTTAAVDECGFAPDAPAPDADFLAEATDRMPEDAPASSPVRPRGAGRSLSAVRSSSAARPCGPVRCTSAAGPRSPSLVRGRPARPRLSGSGSRSGSESAPPATPRSLSIEHPLLRRAAPAKVRAPEHDHDHVHGVPSVELSVHIARGRPGRREDEAGAGWLGCGPAALEAGA